MHEEDGSVIIQDDLDALLQASESRDTRFGPFANQNLHNFHDALP